MTQVVRVGSRLCGIVVMTLMVALAVGAFAAEKENNIEMIVVFNLKDGEEKTQLQGLKQEIEANDEAKKLGIQVVRILSLSDALALKFPVPESPDEAAKAIENVLIFLNGLSVEVKESYLKKLVIFQLKGTLAEREAALKELASAIEAEENLGIKVMHILELIDALAVQFPASRLDDVRAFLESLGGQVFADPLARLNSLTRTAGQTGAANEKKDDKPLDNNSQDTEEAEDDYPWNMQAIGVPQADAVMPNVNAAGVRVAIMDTGIYLHPDLAPNIDTQPGFNALPELLGGGQCTGKQTLCTDGHGHGTHIAGIIIGIAPQAKLVPVKVLQDDATGFLSDLINGLGWVYDNNIWLVNMSLSFSADSFPPSGSLPGDLPLQLAIQRLAEEKDVIMVAAGGNRTDGGSEDGDGGDEEGPPSECSGVTTHEDGDGDGGAAALTISEPAPIAVKYPALYDKWVIAVAATDINNQITSYSPEGLELDVVAPGGALASVRILSTTLDGQYACRSGTSQAAAHVTGAVARVLHGKPKLSFEDVLSVLQTTATPLIDPNSNPPGQPYPLDKQGVGLLNVGEMVKDYERR
jgi:subtilisin family serine protease